MRGLQTPKPDRRLVRLARWLGFDRNPLRRGTDRVEAILRLFMILVLVLAVPAAAVAAGRWADHDALRRAQAERTHNHQVTAVLLQDAPATGTPDPYTSVPTAWVLAHRALDRQRLRGWEAEWRASGPLWRGHRS